MASWTWEGDLEAAIQWYPLAITELKSLRSLGIATRTYNPADGVEIRLQSFPPHVHIIAAMGGGLWMAYDSSKGGSPNYLYMGYQEGLDDVFTDWDQGYLASYNPDGSNAFLILLLATGVHRNLYTAIRGPLITRVFGYGDITLAKDVYENRDVYKVFIDNDEATLTYSSAGLIDTLEWESFYLGSSFMPIRVKLQWNTERQYPTFFSTDLIGTRDYLEEINLVTIRVDIYMPPREVTVRFVKNGKIVCGYHLKTQLKRCDIYYSSGVGAIVNPQYSDAPGPIFVGGKTNSLGGPTMYLNKISEAALLDYLPEGG